MLILFLYFYLFFVRMTSRFRLESESREAILLFRQQRPVIYSFWYENLQLVMLYFRSRNACIYFHSLSRTDANLTLAKSFGFSTSVSNHESGGRHALIILMEKLKSQVPLLVTADGPRTHEKRYKTQSLLLSQETGSEIIPVSFKPSSSFTIKVGGEKMILPLPFSRISVRLGSPVLIKKHLQIEELEGIRLVLENTLKALSR